MAEIYEINSDKFTQVEPTGEEEIQIGANKKTTLQAIADLHKDDGGLDLESPIDGFTPLETGGTTMESTFSLLQALQMLYRIGGNGSIKMVGDSSNKFGLVSIGDNTLAGILFNTSNNTLYILDSTNVVNAKQVTDLEIMNWITNGTAIPLGVTPDVDISKVLLTGFTPLETVPELVNLSPKNGDSLLDSIKKLSFGILSNGKIIIGGDGDTRICILQIYNSPEDEEYYYRGMVIDLEVETLYTKTASNINNIVGKTIPTIMSSIIGNPSSILELQVLLSSVMGPSYSSSSSSLLSISGGDSYFYKPGSTLTPTIQINSISFNVNRPTAVFICPCVVKPKFSIKNPSSNVSLHLHTELDNLSNSSCEFKVYTIYMQSVNRLKHFFVNVDTYKN